MKQVVSLFLISILFLSCEKNIDIKLEEAPPKLVVEAIIENDSLPRVMLTRSLAFFSTVNLQTLSQSFVHNAEVYMSNGILTHKLKEYEINLIGGLSLFYYSIDSSSPATAFKGELDRSYSLRVVTGGEEFTAVTTIPDTTKTVDSIWWKKRPPPDTSEAVIMVRVTDPPGFGDYIRYFTAINGGPFLAPRSSANDDLFIDGTTYEVEVRPGTDRNDLTDFRDFKQGDTVQLKLSNIDKATFDFWRTLEFSYRSVGNPFSTPTKVLSNISNGALGYFGGYASRYRTIILN